MLRKGKIHDAHQWKNKTKKISNAAGSFVKPNTVFNVRGSDNH